MYKVMKIINISHDIILKMTLKLSTTHTHTHTHTHTSQPDYSSI